MKTCSRCRINKENSSFSPDKNKKDGLMAYCKDCRNSIRRKNNKINSQPTINELPITDNVNNLYELFLDKMFKLKQSKWKYTLYFKGYCPIVIHAYNDKEERYYYIDNNVLVSSALNERIKELMLSTDHSIP